MDTMAQYVQSETVSPKAELSALRAQVERQAAELAAEKGR